MRELLGYHYEYHPGSSGRTLILLHGTGGDETQMLPLAAQLDETAALIAIRGNVDEHGSLRFFKRHAEGVLDRADLKKRSAALALFLDGVKEAHGLGNLAGVGFSNGANILLHLAATQPALLRATILFRPMSAALPDTTVDLAGLSVFIGAGDEDPMVPLRDAKQLEAVLRAAGAWVEVCVSPAGHGLIASEIDKAREWLATVQ